MRLFRPLLLLLSTSVSLGQTAAAEAENVRLATIDDRPWLIDPAGQPFFAHGVTHAGNVRRRGVAFDEMARTFKELGFNAYGYGCPNELKSDMPYVEGRNDLVPISTYRTDGSFHYLDVFDPEVQARMEDQIRKTCFANRKNRNLIGYCWTDLGAWPLETANGKNWVDFIRELPANAPGRQAYEEFLQSWNGKAPETRDRAFLRLIAREYCRVLGEANRRFDPDHLIFGDRFSFPTVVPEVIEEMLPYVDAIAVQPRFNRGFPKKEFDRIHELSGKPILICDFAIRFAEEGKKIRGWKPETGPAAAGEQYAAYLREAMATPYIIGVFWCNPMNSQPGFNKTGIKQGLFGDGFTPRPELNRAVREVNRHREEITPKT